MQNFKSIYYKILNLTRVILLLHVMYFCHSHVVMYDAYSSYKYDMRLFELHTHYGLTAFVQ